MSCVHETQTQSDVAPVLILSLFGQDPKSKEKQDTASEDGNVLNIIARALLARRTAIKDDEENEDEELWE